MSTSSFRFDHVMLPVRDVARSIAFYTGALGMKVLEQRADDTRRIAHVGYAERGLQASLELIENIEAQPAIVTGDGHFCLRVSGLAGLVEALQREGALVDKPPMTRNGTARAWIRDLDGHLIELSEPAQADER